jgi:hypothetical protein
MHEDEHGWLACAPCRANRRYRAFVGGPPWTPCHACDEANASPGREQRRAAMLGAWHGRIFADRERAYDATPAHQRDYAQCLRGWPYPTRTC